MSIETEVVTVVDDTEKLPADAVIVWKKLKAYVAGLLKRLRTLVE